MRWRRLKTPLGLVLSFFIVLMLGFTNCTKSSSSDATDTPMANGGGNSSAGGGAPPSDPGLPAQPAVVPDFTKLTPSCFTVDSASPYLPAGSFFTGSEWNDPHVIKVGTDFVMYASADTNFSQNIKIYRFVSTDGKNWNLSPANAVFERSADNLAWDRGSIETPAVVFFQGHYFMFYTGYSDQADSSTYNIGYATSPDGITWTRAIPHLAPTNPKGSPDLNFMQYVVGEPAPVVFNNKLYLYFAAEGAHLSVNSTLFTIGLMTSDDGVNWSTPAMALAPDQSMYPRSTYLGYSTPHAQVLNNQVHLFFDVAKDNPFKQVKIHHAVSPDGLGNWVQDATAIIDRASIPWADDQVNGPAVLLDGNKLYLWFGGQGNLSAFPNINMGLGLATCTL